MATGNGLNDLWAAHAASVVGNYVIRRMKEVHLRPYEIGRWRRRLPHSRHAGGVQE